MARVVKLVPKADFKIVFRANHGTFCFVCSGSFVVLVDLMLKVAKGYSLCFGEFHRPFSYILYVQRFAPQTLKCLENVVLKLHRQLCR